MEVAAIGPAGLADPADPLVRVHDWEVVTGPDVRTIDGHPYFADEPLPSDHLPVMASVTLRGRHS